MKSPKKGFGQILLTAWARFPVGVHKLFYSRLANMGNSHRAPGWPTACPTKHHHLQMALATGWGKTQVKGGKRAPMGLVAKKPVFSENKGQAGLLAPCEVDCPVPGRVCPSQSGYNPNSYFPASGSLFKGESFNRNSDELDGLLKIELKQQECQKVVHSIFLQKEARALWNVTVKLNLAQVTHPLLLLCAHTPEPG